MVSSLAKWLVRMQYYKLSGIFLTLASNLTGGKCRISYDKRGFWKHQTGSYIINEAFPNIRMDIDALQKFNDSVYFYAYQPSSGDVCVDIGSGIGTETIWMSKKVGSTGKVYAVEASPFIYTILQANVFDNNLTNVVCINAAISDKKGKVKISDIEDAHIENSIFSNSGTEVDALSMDDFIADNQIGRIDFIKVNIEGAERLLIKGFEGIRLVRHAAISCHDFLFRRNGDKNMATKAFILPFLTEKGFQVKSQTTGVDYIDDYVYAEKDAGL